MLAPAAAAKTASPVGLDDILSSVDRLLHDMTVRVVIVVLFGAPGRGKTTLATHVGTAQDQFTELNSSSERRGYELREALNRFISDGNQAGVRFRHRQASRPPCCALLLDEADGLGAIGQATVASFIDELEQDGCLAGSVPGGAAPSPGGAAPAQVGAPSSAKEHRWRALVMLTCNTLGLLHDSILSRAHVLAEVPRPTPDTLVRAARQWLAAPEFADSSSPAPASFPESRLHEIAGMADGDFRAMRQLLTLEMCGSRGSLAAPVTPTLRALLKVLQGADDYNMAAWQSAWNEGRRADDIQHWVTMALYLPTLSPERRLALLKFRRSLEAMQRFDGPHSLLQIVGAFARDVVGVRSCLRG